MHSEGAAGEDQGHGVLAVRLELAIQRHLRGSETGNVGWRQLVGSSDAELRTLDWNHPFLGCITVCISIYQLGLFYFYFRFLWESKTRVYTDVLNSK